METKESIPSSRLLYTADEVAAMLKVHVRTVRRLISRGALKKAKAIRHIRIPKESIDAFIKSTTN
jgi:excisionase family DNA binding protein